VARVHLGIGNRIQPFLGQVMNGADNPVAALEPLIFVGSHHDEVVSALLRNGDGLP
jgi:hypothetical protein